MQYVKVETPIIIFVDMFDLPWSEYYRRVHDFDCLIVLEHKSDTVFYVYDATMEMNGIELDMKDVFAA